MYAVIRSGGKQYRVSQGDLIEVERIEGDVGSAVTFGEVLFVGNDSSPQVGSPLVDNAEVRGTIESQKKGDKVVVFKFKRRKMYRRKNGHRQLMTVVRIGSIEAPSAGEKSSEAVEKAPPAKETEVPASEAKTEGAKQPPKAQPPESAAQKTATRESKKVRKSSSTTSTGLKSAAEKKPAAKRTGGKASKQEESES